MKILDFGFFSPDDRVDKNFYDGHAWSRPYEYNYVLDKLLRLDANKTRPYPHIHNSSWGFEGIHIKFKESIDSLFVENVIHSDIKASDLKNTCVYDITKAPPEEFVEKFDYVINVSTIEEINYDNIEIFNNLMLQVKTGGHLILTFDHPGLQLPRFEDMLGQKIYTPTEKLNPKNSVVPNESLSSNLNVGYLTIKKT